MLRVSSATTILSKMTPNYLTIFSSQMTFYKRQTDLSLEWFPSSANTLLSALSFQLFLGTKWLTVWYLLTLSLRKITFMKTTLDSSSKVLFGDAMTFSAMISDIQLILTSMECTSKLVSCSGTILKGCGAMWGQNGMEINNWILSHLRRETRTNWQLGKSWSWSRLQPWRKQPKADNDLQIVNLTL